MTNNTQDRHTDSGGKKLVSLIRRTVALCILGVAVVAGIQYWQKANHAPKAVQGHAQQRVTPVHVVTMKPKDVPLEPEYLGQTEASQTVEIRSRVRGFLESKHFEEGSNVEAGQLLFRIDPRSFQADLDLARARLASAQAQLARANQKVKRYTKLRKNSAVTADELEQWETEESVARANITMEKARITQAELDLGYTSIESPITGIIGMAKKDVGSYVNDSTDGLLAVVEKVDPIYVRYSVSEQDILQARRMAKQGVMSGIDMSQLTLGLTLADGTDYPFAGTITYTDPQIDPDTASSLIRGTFPNPEGTLVPGQFVHVHIKGIDRLNALLVPKQAVIQNPTGAFVNVMTADNKVELRNITLGPWHKDQWIVESGLNAGDVVIVDKVMQLRPGMPVEPLPADDTASSDASTTTTGTEHSSNAG